jgi:hypothetical protein
MIHGSLPAPESDLERITERIVTVVPRDKNDLSRIMACRWLNRLFYDVRRWNTGFIEFLRTYPGFQQSRDVEEYRRFFRELAQYRRSLDGRYGSAKGDLCADLKMLAARFPKDFLWLYESDEQKYDELYYLVHDAYASENSIIDKAMVVINAVIAKQNVPYASDVEWELNTTEFLEWHVDHHLQVVQLILDYETQSGETVERLSDFADNAGIRLLTLAEYAAGLSDPVKYPDTMVLGELVTTERETVRPNPLSHQTARLNTILAFAFGAIFIGAILALAVFIPNPTPTQYHVFTVVMALAAGGITTVMAGMINVRVSFGQRLTIGATGALGVFVIVYFFLPAMTAVR